MAIRRVRLGLGRISEAAMSPIGHPAAGRLVPTSADLGRAVRRLRRERGVSIQALACTAGMHPTYLSGIERGVRNPSWEKITRLARALDLPVWMIARKADAEAEVALAARETRWRIATERRGLDD